MKNEKVRIIIVILTAVCLFVNIGIGERGSWDCEKCGKKGNAGKFCGNCGSPFPDGKAEDEISVSSSENSVPSGHDGREAADSAKAVWACPSCGKQNSSKFCPACGTSRSAAVCGSWKLSRVSLNHVDAPANALARSAYLDLWENGMCLFLLKDEDGFRHALGQWSQSQDEITITGNDFSYVIYFRNDEIAWDSEDACMFLSRTDRGIYTGQNAELGQVSRLRTYMISEASVLFDVSDAIDYYYYKDSDKEKLIETALEKLRAKYSLSEADRNLIDRLTDQRSETELILKDVNQGYHSFDALTGTMAFIKYRYPYTDVTSLIYEASSGLFDGLEDPGSYIYNPDEWNMLWENDGSSQAAIGIAMSADHEKNTWTISRVFPGGPAAKAGMRRGDVLLRIGDVPVDNFQTDNRLVSMLQGEAGSAIDITVLQAGREMTFHLIRDYVDIKLVQSTMLPNSVGLIALQEIGGNCEKEFTDALELLAAEGAKKIIIDLRNNSGGWMEKAQYIADLFMDQGDLGYLVYRDGQKDFSYPTKDGKIQVPLAVIVNENTALAAEFLAEALKEKASAAVVGVKTYGQNTLQVVLPLGENGGGYQLTVATFYSPDGLDFHNGVLPDYEVPLPAGDTGEYLFGDVEKDVQLREALNVLLYK